MKNMKALLNFLNKPIKIINYPSLLTFWTKGSGKKRLVLKFPYLLGQDVESVKRGHINLYLLNLIIQLKLNKLKNFKKSFLK